MLIEIIQQMTCCQPMVDINEGHLPYQAIVLQQSELGLLACCSFCLPATGLGPQLRCLRHNPATRSIPVTAQYSASNKMQSKHLLATNANDCVSPRVPRCQRLMCRSALRHGTGQQRAECRDSSPQPRHTTCQRSRTTCQMFAATLGGRHVTVTNSLIRCAGRWHQIASSGITRI